MNLISKTLKVFTWFLVSILGLILIYTTIEYLILVIRTIANSNEIFDFNSPKVDIDKLFLVHVQGLIAGVLLITIIVELIQTLIASLDDSKRNNLLLILFEIGTIAVIRHLFIYELDHLKGLNIIGIALLLLVLGGLNILFRPAVLDKIVGKKRQNEV